MENGSYSGSRKRRCNTAQIIDMDLEDDLSSDYESDEDFKTLYCCNICGASNMELATFLQHSQKHSKKERTAVLDKLVNDKAWANAVAKSAAAAFGFKLQPSVKSSVPLYVCIVCGQGNLTLKCLSEHSSLHPEFMLSHFCNLCQQHFKGEAELSTHLGTHLDSNDLICQYCNRRFNAIDDLELHERSHDRAEFVCAECRQSFSCKEHVLVHLKDTHCISLVCTICVLEFKSKSLLDNHLIAHVIVSAVKNPMNIFLCVVCGKKYDSKISLQRHNLFLHNDRTPFICEFCGFPTYHQDSLRDHHIKDHSDVTFLCKECNTLFFKKLEYDNHMIKHTKQKIFNCRLCGSKFIKLDNLEIHLKVHGEKVVGDNSYFVEEVALESELSLHGFEERPFNCETCGESFTEQSSYEDHFKKMHEKIVCNMCGISFHNDSDLNKHLHKVHSSKMLKNSKVSGLPFKCHVCSASFKLEFELEKHSNNHVLYQCHLCFEEFTFDASLQRHLENDHTGEACESS